MLTVPQVCEITGWSKGYVYNILSSGKLTHYKPFGKKVYIKIEDLEKLANLTPILSVESKANETIKNIRI